LTSVRPPASGLAGGFLCPVVPSRLFTAQIEVDERIVFPDPVEPESIRFGGDVALSAASPETIWPTAFVAAAKISSGKRSSILGAIEARYGG